MHRRLLKFGALQTKKLVPVTGCECHIAVAKHLHALGTTHAYRALGGILSSNLIKRQDYNKQLDDYAHNEVWAHLKDDVRPTSDGSHIATIAKNNAWDKVDFFVLLTVYHGSKDTPQSDKLEVRVVINSSKQGSPNTVESFAKFTRALWGVWNGKSVFFKGIEDYLLNSVPGLEYLIRFQSLNYALNSSEWGKTSYYPKPFAESQVAQELGLKMCEVTANDLSSIEGLNFYNPDNKYLELCCPVTSCIRQASDMSLASWIFCHADSQMGVLRTVDSYKGRGLAKYVVHDLGNKMINDFSNKVSTLYRDCTPNNDYVIQMIVEKANIVPLKLYEKFGFKCVADVTWAECKF
ncbi:hypothetical protein IWW50_004942 [Coemansia erecta]|nr:hypothetical protein GGF43_004318 [Coemansia sp. RSA 2618]KAJ2820721.1 hypothetical protein IWW50_004942 [Coemansia erecta]